MDFSRGEVAACSNVREADEGVPECELAWMIKLEPRYSIAEGFTRRGDNDKIRFFNMAEGSVEESRYYLILAQDLGYGQTDQLMSHLEEVSRLLKAYVKAVPAPGS